MYPLQVMELFSLIRINLLNQKLVTPCSSTTKSQVTRKYS